MYYLGSSVGRLYMKVYYLGSSVGRLYMKMYYLDSSVGRLYMKVYGCMSMVSVKLTTVCLSSETAKEAAANITSLSAT